MLNRFGSRRLVLVCALALIVAIGVPTLASSQLSPSPARNYRTLVGRDGARAFLDRSPGHAGVLAVTGDRARAAGGGHAGTLELWAKRNRRTTGRPADRVSMRWGTTWLVFAKRLPRSRWTHVVVDWTQSAVTLSFDGHAVETHVLGPPAGAAAPHSLDLGADASAVTVRDVAIYPEPLGADAVLAHFAAGQPVLGLAGQAAPGDRETAHAAAGPTNTVPPTISGTAKDGQTLTSTTGTWTGSPTSYARQWQRCDGSGLNCTNISAATGASYLLTSADVGATIRVKVTATSTGGSTAASSAQTTVVIAAAPVNSALPALSGTARDGQTLTSTTGTWTGTTPLTYARQWRRCNTTGASCVDIAGATGTTYTLTATDIGDTARAVVTASNGAGSSAATTATTATVTAASPANTAAPAITGTAKEGQLLTATTGTWSGTTPITYSYQWQSCAGTACAAISGATASTYRLVGAQVSKTINIVVTATNTAGSANATSAATATVTTGAPVNTAAPTITGTALDGQTLTSTNGSWAGTATITYSRQWKRCNAAGGSCTTIASATGTSYTLTAADVGSTIKLTVTATNGVGGTGADSAVTPAVAAIAPANTSSPSITGTTTDGQTLTSTNGGWSGSTPLTYARQWSRCDTAGTNCQPISGATANTYTLTSTDVGATVKVAVTATNAAGSATASSTPSATIIGRVPVNTTAPTITGSAQAGQTLTTAVGTWSGTTPISYSRQWRRCATTGSPCTDITGADGTTYNLAAADVGFTIALNVTATNIAGTATATTTSTSAVTGIAPSTSGSPTITGVARVGGTLSAQRGSWDGIPTPSFGYEWQRCDDLGANCLAISGALGADYTLLAADLGHTIRLHLTATNVTGQADANSATTGVTTAASLVNTTAPEITGSARAGHQLNATPGGWDSAAAVTVTYQWQRCEATGVTCAAITDATDEGYDVDEDDVGHRLRVVATASDGHLDATQASSLTDVVQGATSEQPAITLTGNLVADPSQWLTDPSYGLTVAVTAGADADGLQATTVSLDGETLAHWDAPCDGGGCASSNTLTVDTASLPDGGHDLLVTATDRDGNSAHAIQTVLIDHGAPQPASALTIADDAGAYELSWTPSSSPDVTSYRILRRTNPANSYTTLTETDDTSFRDELPPATPTVQYAVEAIDGAANTSSLTELTIDPAASAPSAPTGLTMGLTDGNWQLSWSAAPSTTGYVVYEQLPDGDAPSEIARVTAPTTSYATPAEDTPGDYSFQIRSVDSDGRLSPPTSPLTRHLDGTDGDAAPALLLSGALADDEIQLQTGTVELDVHAADEAGVAQVQAFVDDDLAHTWTPSCPEAPCDIDATWSLDTSQFDDGEHDVRIVATNTRGRSTDADLTINTDNNPPSAPVSAWIDATGDNPVVHWIGPSDADVASYRVVDGQGGWWATPSVDDPTEAEVGGCDDGCTFSVIAIDEAGREGDPAEVHYEPGPAPTPPTLTASAAAGAVTLSWTDTSAAGYLVFRATAIDGAYEQITRTPVTATTFLEDDDVPGETYFYVVRSLTVDGAASAASNIVTATVPHAGSVPSIALTGTLADHQGETLDPGDYALAVNASESGGAIEWLETSVDGVVDGHHDEPCPQGGCTLQDTFDFDTGDYDDGPHLIEVTAIDAHHETTVASFTVTTNAAPPATIDGLHAAATSANSVHLSWNDSPEDDLASYRIYRGTSATDLTLLATTDAPADTYDDQGTPTATTLWYAVQSLDEHGDASPMSKPVSALPGGAAAQTVINLHAQVEPYSVTLSWDAVDAADLTGYYVYRTMAGTADAQRLTSAPTSDAHYVDNSLAVGSVATYVVTTVDKNGHEGAKSAPATVTAQGVRAGTGVSPTLSASGSGDYTILGPNDLWLGTDRFDAPPVKVPCVPTAGAPCSGMGRVLGLALSPDGHHALQTEAADSGEQLVLGDLQTGEQRVLCDYEYNNYAWPPCRGDGPSFTPDGTAYRYLAPGGWDPVSETNRYPVWERTLSGDDVHQVFDPTDARADALSGAIITAADGSTLMTGLDIDDQRCVILKFEPNGALQLKRTTATPTTSCDMFNMTTDGDQLVSVDESFGYPRVVISDFDGTHRRFVSPTGVAATYCCEMSPDGQRVMFSGSHVETDANGTAIPAPVLYVGGMNYNTASLPDGLSLDADQGPSLYTADIGSGELRSQKIDYQSGPFAQPSTFGPVYPQASAAVKLSTDMPQTTVGRKQDTLVAGAAAVGINTTVDELALYVGGERHAATGTAEDASFRLPLSGLAEGRHTTRLVAGTTEGLERSLNRTIVVDDTAPTVPDEASAARDDTAGTTTVSWEPIKDPALADGSEGSGVAATRYRYRHVDGTWSGWVATTTNSFTAATSTLGDAIDIDADDAAGNHRRIRAQMLQEVHYVSGECNPVISSVTRSEVPGMALQYRITETQARVNASVACMADVTQLQVTNMCLDVLINGSWRASPHNCYSSEDKNGKRQAVDGHTVKFALRWVCQRPSDGQVGFRIRGNYQVWTNEFNDPKIGMTSKPVFFECPKEADRVAAEAKAWRSLSGGRSKASRLLRNSMTVPAPFDEGGWAAHHLIPANESTLEASYVQSIGFRCRVYVNDRGNGLYLRMRGGVLGNGTQDYNALRPDLKRRAQHWNYGKRYSAAIAPTLQTYALDRDGNCRGAVPARKTSTGLRAIHLIAQELAGTGKLPNGTARTEASIPGIGASPPN